MTGALEKESSEFKSHGGARVGAGRPAGVVNKTTSEIRALAGAWGPVAVEKAAMMAGLVEDEAGKPIGQAESEQVRLAALQMLLDRGFGKSTATISGEDGPAEVSLRWADDAIGTARRIALVLGQAARRMDKDQ